MARKLHTVVRDINTIPILRAEMEDRGQNGKRRQRCVEVWRTDLEPERLVLRQSFGTGQVGSIGWLDRWRDAFLRCQREGLGLPEHADDMPFERLRARRRRC